MRCLYCGKQLSILRRLQNQRFCSKEHHQAYVKNHHERAFGELLKRTQPGRPADEEDSPSGEDEAAELTATSLTAAAEAVGAAAQSSTPEAGSESAFAISDALDPAAQPAAESAPALVSALEEEAPEPGTPEHYARFLAMVEAERHYYQNILDLLPAGVAVFDGRLSLVYSNRKFRETVSLSADESQGTKLTGLFAQNDVLPAVQEAVDTEEPVTVRGAVGDQGRWDLTLIPIAPHDAEGSRHLLVYVAGAAGETPAS